MNNNLYPWQVKEWQHLMAYVEQQRIPQALLIKGGEGLGKQHLALQFAQHLMCIYKNKQQPCGQCESCVLFAAQTHPDFMVLEPRIENKTIGIDLVRDLMTKLVLKPQYSGYRVVLIRPADRLTMNAANAFLKCLEEPPERTLFLLVLVNITHLPVTIMSRCQQLLIAPPDYSMAEQWLQSQGVDNNAISLLNMANGSPLLALKYAETDALVLRESCFQEWKKVVNVEQCPIELAEKWHTLPLKLVLVWLCSWVEDMIKYHLKLKGAYFSNPDLALGLQGLVDKIILKGLFDFYQLLLQSTERLQTSLNKQLIVEEILITAFQLRNVHY